MAVSKRQREICRWLLQQSTPASTPDIAKEFNISRRHACRVVSQSIQKIEGTIRDSYFRICKRNLNTSSEFFAICSARVSSGILSAKRSALPAIPGTNLGEKGNFTCPVEPSVTKSSSQFSENSRSSNQMGTICIQQILQSRTWSKT